MIRRLYGDTALHALGHLACFALAGYAIVRLTDVPPGLWVAGWFVGAVVLHDFVLLPAYAVLDRLALRPLRRGANYLRVPLGISALLALVYAPVILGKGEANYERVSGQTYEGYLARWLLISAVLFAISGVLYLVRSRGQRSAGSSS